MSFDKILGMALQVAHEQHLDRVLVARQVYCALLTGKTTLNGAIYPKELTARAFHLADEFIREAKSQTRAPAQKGR
jgi:hypothetical protein